jgi:hypothetical protein
MGEREDEEADEEEKYDGDNNGRNQQRSPFGQIPGGAGGGQVRGGGGLRGHELISWAEARRPAITVRRWSTPPCSDEDMVFEFIVVGVGFYRICQVFGFASVTVAGE